MFNINLLTLGYFLFVSLGLTCAKIDNYDWNLLKDSSDALKNTYFKSEEILANHQDHTCQLQVQSESFSNKENELLSAYAGNAFSYELGCHINDPLMKVGDKYYIIDLIVYGPNNRVAKAWREQFSISSLFKNRNMFMNKKISFRFLGLNKVICSITKYNNLLNQFARICEKATTVNATENLSETLKNDNEKKLNAISTYKSSLMKYMLPSKALLFRQSGELLKNGTKLQRQLSGIQNSSNFLSNLKIKEIIENYSSNDGKFLTTSKIDLLSTDKIINQLNESDDKVVSLKSKTMQFRNLVKADSKAEQLNEKNTVYTIDQSDNQKLKYLKPLSVIMLFVIVFSVSICTIIYLTYHQKSSNTEYDSVKVDEPNLSDETDTSQHTIPSPQVQKVNSRLKKLRLFRKKRTQDVISNSEDSQNLSTASTDEKTSHEIENSVGKSNDQN